MHTEFWRGNPWERRNLEERGHKQKAFGLILREQVAITGSWMKLIQDRVQWRLEAKKRVYAITLGTLTSVIHSFKFSDGQRRERPTR
jgi:hypothetical protein